MKKQKHLAICMALMLASFTTLMLTAPLPMSATPQRPSGSFTTSILQSLPGGSFVGTLTINSFALVNGVINAVGTISGTFTPTSGTPTTVNGPITIPLQTVTGTCTILTLQTGAISLSLLGLNVNLSPLNLAITATAAPGNLLGNLLCAVAHLLDSNGSLTALVNLLNHVLTAL